VELAAEARRILVNLGERVDSRLRVVDTQRNLLADSAVISAVSPVEDSASYQPEQDEAGTADSAEAGAGDSGGCR
jgi:hypothetical protein